MKNKVLSISLISISVVVLATVASAAQITKIGVGHDPAIYGNNITWSDTSGSIHIYDLTTKKDIKINSSNASHPVIYGNKLVWHDESLGIPRLTVYDIPSGARSYITQNVDQYSIPTIYGSRIVWKANMSVSNISVYMKDMSTSIQIKIGSSRRSLEPPSIFDTKVVYVSSDEPGGDYTVQMYDINTKKKIAVNFDGGDPHQPRIWGTKVIWADHSNFMGYIEMYDMSTNKTIAVTADLNTDPNGNQYGASTGTHIAIQDDKIVYNKCVDDYEGKPGVYIYNISTGKSTLLFEYSGQPNTTPEVYGNKVVWGDDSSNINVCVL
jgi:beta propeller repeat protein